ncbi:MAG: DUF3606 domain-containing protein [Dongiaceae bacterium]
MPNNLKLDFRSSIPVRINLTVSWERDWWCEIWNVTEKELRAAIFAVGTSAPSVARHLGRRIPVGRPSDRGEVRGS